MKCIGYSNVICLLLVLCLVGCSGPANPERTFRLGKSGIVPKSSKKKESAVQFSGPLFFWKVTKSSNRPPEEKTTDGSKDDQPIHYLLGTPPTVSNNFLPLPEAIQQPFQKSKILLIQSDPAEFDGVKTTKILMQGSQAETGKALMSYLTPELQKKWKDHLKKLGLPEDAYSKFRPWSGAWQLLRQQLAIQNSGSGNSLETHVLASAQTNNMEVRTLEKPETPLAKAQHLDEQLELLLVEHILMLGKNLRGRSQDAFMAWVAGDPALFHRLLRSDFQKQQPKLERLYEEFYDQRSKLMADQMDAYFSKNKTTFAVVQADHIGGEKGLLKLLQSKGYQLTQVHAKNEQDNTDGQ
ncbi:MAG: TraB/GumN family protein [Gemmataceae bacterium]